MKKIRPFFLFTFCTVLSFNNALAQEAQFFYNGSGNYTLVERTDLRRYDNGKYIGLVSREVRSFICSTSSALAKNEDSRFYDGNFYVEEKTRRDNMQVKKGLHVSIPSQFIIERDGDMIMVEDNGYPSFRSFPAFTDQKIKAGSKWSANAVRSVDPLNKNVFTKIPMLVEYTYLNDDVFHDEEVYVLSACWATRYGTSYVDYDGDKELIKAAGSHNATMYVSKNTGCALVVRDQVDETFVYSDGKQIAFKGTISLFTEYPPSSDTKPLIAALKKANLITDEQGELLAVSPKPQKNPAEKKDGGASTNGGGTAAKGSGTSANAGGAFVKGGGASVSSSKAEDLNSKNISVQKTDAGVMLQIQNLQFKSDSAELLPGEEKRLDEIASILKTIPKNMFLVEGHTADTGFASGEKKLSEERALSIAEELSKRGIESERFICRGSGALKPIAPNNTPEGKAKNRRVEITILE